MTVVLMSGVIATGKTAAAIELAIRLDGTLIRVRDALRDVLGLDARDRQALQKRGADLDQRTGGRWLKEYLEERRDAGRSLIVDALRTRRQTLPILDGFVDSRLVYLEAHEDTRRWRYAVGAESDPVKASIDFDSAMHHPTESEVQHLRSMAHAVIATDDLDVQAVVDEIVLQLHLVL